MPAAPAAPPPVSAQTPQSPAAQPPAPKAPVTPTGETPMARAKARMAASAVEADLSDPNPERTIREKPKAPEPPKPKGQDDPPTPKPETDPLETDDPPKPEPPKPTDQPKPEDEPITEAELKAEKPPEKAGPWKLKKYWEKRAAAIEMERNQLKEKLDKLPNIERLEAIDKRNKELEEEIRYHNYAKSQEYAEKYQKPYEEAWAKAISDLGELEVLAEDGSVARKATSNDLLSLARMPLGEARKAANQMFGDSASDVMMHRQRIRDLADAQNKALEDARKTGTERQTQMADKMKAIHSEVTTLWEKFNKEDGEKLEFLKSKEGDDEWNGKLDKAKAMADEAFSKNATDPRLTPEERAKLIRTTSAMRNRSIAYSTLKLENSRLRAQIKERDEKLKQFEASEPTAGQSGGNGSQAKPAATPMERARQRLHAASVPAPQYF